MKKINDYDDEPHFGHDEYTVTCSNNSSDDKTEVLHRLQRCARAIYFFSLFHTHTRTEKLWCLAFLLVPNIFVPWWKAMLVACRALGLIDEGCNSFHSRPGPAAHTLAHAHMRTRGFTFMLNQPNRQWLRYFEPINMRIWRWITLHVSRMYLGWCASAVGRGLRSCPGCTIN